MFRRFHVAMLLAGTVVLAGAYATAALTAVTIDRTVSAEVKADNDANVAVKMVCLDNSGGGGTDYTGLCQYDANGELTIELHRIIGAAYGFNPDATFVIGEAGANQRVFQVTNNAPVDIKVGFNATDITMQVETSGAAVGAAGSGNEVTVSAGTSKEFYFTVTTPASPPATLSGTVQIRKA